MSNTKQGKKSGKKSQRPPLPIRLPPDEERQLRLAARAETGGNVSEFVRRAVRERIQQMLTAA